MVMGVLVLRQCAWLCKTVRYSVIGHITPSEELNDNVYNSSPTGHNHRIKAWSRIITLWVQQYACKAVVLWLTACMAWHDYTTIHMQHCLTDIHAVQAPVHHAWPGIIRIVRPTVTDFPVFPLKPIQHQTTGDNKNERRAACLRQLGFLYYIHIQTEAQVFCVL